VAHQRSVAQHLLRHQSVWPVGIPRYRGAVLLRPQDLRQTAALVNQVVGGGDAATVVHRGPDQVAPAVIAIGRRDGLRAVRRDHPGQLVGRIILVLVDSVTGQVAVGIIAMCGVGAAVMAVVGRNPLLIDVGAIAQRIIVIARLGLVGIGDVRQSVQCVIVIAGRSIGINLFTAIAIPVQHRVGELLEGSAVPGMPQRRQPPGAIIVGELPPIHSLSDLGFARTVLNPT
jgi:hypothetical protein